MLLRCISIRTVSLPVEATHGRETKPVLRMGVPHTHRPLPPPMQPGDIPSSTPFPLRLVEDPFLLVLRTITVPARSTQGTSEGAQNPFSMATIIHKNLDHHVPAARSPGMNRGTRLPHINITMHRISTDQTYMTHMTAATGLKSKSSTSGLFPRSGYLKSITPVHPTPKTSSHHRLEAPQRASSMRSWK